MPDYILPIDPRTELPLSGTPPPEYAYADPDGPDIDEPPDTELTIPDPEFVPLQTQFLIDTVYDTDTGDDVYPVAGPPGTPGVKVSEHGGRWTKIVQWTCERIGEQPILPHWDTQNANEVLRRRRIHPSNRLIMGNGQYVYRRTGRYEYALLNPPDVFHGGLVEGTCPYDPDPDVQTKIGEDRFDRRILRAN